MAKVLISFSQVLPLGIKPLTIGMNITISIDFGGQPSRAYPKSRKAHAFVSFDHILSPPQIRVCPSQIFLISLSQCTVLYFLRSSHRHLIILSQGKMGVHKVSHGNLVVCAFNVVHS